jgi:hypothetical protein
MPNNNVNLEAQFPITENQRFIAWQALEATGGIVELFDEVNPAIVDDFIRMMVIIQASGMQSYFVRGVRGSLHSRARREPELVEAEKENLWHQTDELKARVEIARGRAASRIRSNRNRFEREVEEDMQIFFEDDEFFEDEPFH